MSCVGAAVFCVALLGTRPGAAAEPARVAWDPAWGDIAVGEWVLGGVAGATALVTALLPPRADHWRDVPGFDADARAALRLDGAAARRGAALASDVTVGFALAYPFVVDSLLVAGVARRSPDVAWRMAAIDGEVIAVTMALQGIAKVLSSRERPYGRDCAPGIATAPDGSDCAGDFRYRSFFSGHTAMAFAAAGASCSHHLNLALYGDGVGDGLACAGAFVVAGVTGALRVASDRHYLSDVLVGASVGTLIGLGLPWLLHYRFDDGPAEPAELPSGPQLSVVPFGEGGAALVGSF